MNEIKDELITMYTEARHSLYEMVDMAYAGSLKESEEFEKEYLEDVKTFKGLLEAIK